MITAVIINPAMVMADGAKQRSCKQKITMVARDVLFGVGATIATLYAMQAFKVVRYDVKAAIKSKHIHEPIDFALSCAQLIVSGLVAKYLWSK
jgi:hypothetical protein